LTPAFSANRAVREYTVARYLPAAAAYADRAAHGGRLGADVLRWQTEIAQSWKDVRFGALKVENRAGMLAFEVQVYLGALDSSVVRVELFADGQDGGEPFRQPMDGRRQSAGGGYLYSAHTAATRPANDFTPRVLPYHPKALVPLEANQILWQK
jgi:starch phosphorylase